MSGERPARRAPAWDPPLTVMLLVFGLVNVTSTVAQARDLGAVLQSVCTELGLDGYTRTDLVPGTSVAVIGSEMLCLLLAIGFAVPRLRAHRLAAWVPLVCAVIAALVITTLTVAALLADPSVGPALLDRR